MRRDRTFRTQLVFGADDAMGMEEARRTRVRCGVEFPSALGHRQSVRASARALLREFFGEEVGVRSISREHCEATGYAVPAASLSRARPNTRPAEPLPPLERRDPLRSCVMLLFGVVRIGLPRDSLELITGLLMLSMAATLLGWSVPRLTQVPSASSFDRPAWWCRCFQSWSGSSHQPWQSSP